MAPRYELLYFNAKGSVEPARLMFAQAGVEFVDTRFSSEEWPKVKPDKKRFPFGQVPVLLIDDRALPQSRAIFRFLAREFNFYGTNSTESSLIDVAVGVIDDLKMYIYANLREKDPARKEEGMKDINENRLPTALTQLEEILKNNNGGKGWFVSDKVSLADILFFSLSERLVQTSPTVFDSYPHLKALLERFKSQENIKKWLANRPVTEY
ncbi:hematopoietic prostaglandin D synthase-like [Antedon mediterranea]|uniref:hematopoietic prostaglandin D synthase-like n=1 Tax=Antedon mediterranea TaxID=105859 RepID=UPI003AF8D89D